MLNKGVSGNILTDFFLKYARNKTSIYQNQRCDEQGVLYLKKTN